MTNKELKKLLERYTSGNCTAEEKSRLEAWCDSLAESGDFQLDEVERQLISEELKNAIDDQIKHQKVRPINFKVLFAAAAVMFFCCLGWLIIKYQNELTNKWNQHYYTETYVPSGKKLTLTLSDHSVIILSGGSRIRYPEHFNHKVREVELLEGEAYFDIHHDAHEPFIVDVAGTQINVLGTAFNVRAYKFLSNVQITVTRGKVSVRGLDNRYFEKAKQVILLPDEQVTIGKASGEIAKRHIDANDATGWIRGKYKFDDETLANVAGMLESYFKIKIRFSEDDIKGIRFSSEFESNDKLDDLLFAICKANNLSYTEQGQNVLLSTKTNQ